MTHRIDTIDTH